MSNLDPSPLAAVYDKILKEMVDQRLSWMTIAYRKFPAIPAATPRKWFKL